MAPVPELKSASLLDRISAFGKQTTAPDEFTLIAMKREAKALLRADAYSAYMALGALAAISWNDEDLDKYHRNAIDISGDELAHKNYAISLQLVLRWEDAFQHALIASQLEPENLTNLERAIEYAALAGNLSAAMELVHDMKARTGKPFKEHDVESIRHTLALTQVPESEYTQGLSIVFETLRKHRVRLNETLLDIDDDPADPTVFLRFNIQAGYRRAQELDNEACARLCEELPDGGHSGILMFSIVGVYHDVHHPL